MPGAAAAGVRHIDEGNPERRVATTAGETMGEVVEGRPAGVAPGGRRYLGLGILALVLGLGAYAVQLAFHGMAVPWYAPLLGTLGSALAGVAALRRRTVTRFAVFGLLVLLTALEWAFLLVFSRLPAYQGPVQVGRPVPDFEAAAAAGGVVSARDLRRGTPSVLVFFRGRW